MLVHDRLTIDILQFGRAVMFMRHV